VSTRRYNRYIEKGGVTCPVLLQRLFVFLTGQQSTLAVVASTLLIAALFTPLRRCIQGFMDRCFYRRRYDARKTLEDFSAQLRNGTYLDALGDDLVGVVRETMRPAMRWCGRARSCTLGYGLR
jgi:hypothetical protein